MINLYVATVITLWFIFSFYFPINDWNCEDENDVPEFIRF